MSESVVARKRSRSASEAPSDVMLAPAPYTVHNDEAVKIKDANGDTIASMFLIHLDGRRPDAEVQATANLFAAAPDLLEALRTLLDEHGHFRDYFEVVDHAAMVKARAAIAKAEGVAPVSPAEGRTPPPSLRSPTHE